MCRSEDSNAQQEYWDLCVRLRISVSFFYTDVPEAKEVEEGKKEDNDKNK